MKIEKATKKEKIIQLVKDKCLACGKCCSFGGCFMTRKEAEVIAKHLNLETEEFIEKYTMPFEKYNKTLLRTKTTDKEKPHSPCIFLKDKICSIHEVKPLHCKISICDEEFGADIQEWYTLNHFVDEYDPESVRQWNIYLKVKEGDPIKGASIKELVKDKKEREKILNFEVLR